MADLSGTQVWLLFRDVQLRRSIYPLLERQAPLLLQSVEADQPLLFQPEPQLPLWLISDFADSAWSDRLAGHRGTVQWIVLGPQQKDFPQARFMNRQDLRRLLQHEARQEPAHADAEEVIFDPRLVEGLWLICDRQDTRLLDCRSGVDIRADSLPRLGEPVQRWLVPQGNRSLQEWFGKVDSEQGVRFRAIRWQDNDRRQWVDVFCAPLPGNPGRLQCHLVDCGAQARLESGLALLERGTRLGTLTQMQQLLAELCQWAEADYAGIVLVQREQLVGEVLAEAGPVRPGEGQWLHLTALVQLMRRGRLELPERADVHLHDNEFIRQNGFESLLVWSVEQDDAQAMLVLAGRETLPDWKHLVQVVRVLAQILGQELNLQAMRNQMHDLKTVNRLTGLPDRVGLIQSLHELNERKESAGLLMLQLDGMDHLRQAHTHEVLDLLYRRLARRLKALENSRIQLFRPLEEGFALLMKGTWRAEPVGQLQQTVKLLLAQRLDLGGGSLQGLTASMGFVQFPKHADRPRELLRKVQLMVGEARRQGGDRCLFYDEEQGRLQLEKGRLLKDMPEAIHEHQFQLHYQPKVRAGTEELVGMEALIRWRHPELGMISPVAFISLAEESGWIVELGVFILETACRFTREVNQRFGLQLVVGVNVAQRQLQEPDFCDQLQRILQRTGLPSAQLDIEVTETQRLGEQDQIQRNLAAIRELGCTVSIDDFGTGHSTLEDLRRIPADCVKLDQSFVRNVGVDPQDEAIIRATVEMCHRLELTLVAEGVENEDQLHFLTGLQCQVMQGYLFSRPLEGQAFVELLAERERLLQRMQGGHGDDRDWIARPTGGRDR